MNKNAGVPVNACLSMLVRSLSSISLSLVTLFLPILSLIFCPVLAQGAGAAGGGSSSVRTEAQDKTYCSKVDALIQQLVIQRHVPGYAFAVIRDGKVMFKKGYGTTDLEAGTPVTSQTVFGLASVTKTFTALALLALVDQGKINLDDPLDKYIKGLATSWKPLTIRQLASMTAGVPKKIPKETVWAAEFKTAQEQPLLFQPGSGYEYSNLSYRTLGSVMEAVTGKKYLDILHELILDPLAMTITGTQVGVPPQQLAWPFQPDPSQGGPQKLSGYRDPAIPFAAGMLFSNIDDMIKYVQALMDRKILSDGGYKTMWQDRPPLSTGIPTKWAFGWALGAGEAYGNRATISMNGGVPGVASSVLIFPQEKVAFIALSNLRKKPVYQITHQAAQLYWGTEGAEGGMNEEGSESSESPQPAAGRIPRAVESSN